MIAPKISLGLRSGKRPGRGQISALQAQERPAKCSTVVRLQASAVNAKRDPNSIAIACRAPWYKETQAPIIDAGMPHLFTGNDDDVAGDIAAFRALGVSNRLFNVVRADLAQSLDAMVRFVSEVAAYGARLKLLSAKVFSKQ